MNPKHFSTINNRRYVHLKVTDLTRSMDFYVGLLGFKVSLAYEEGTAAYLSAGSHHYLLGLATWFAQHLPQFESQGTDIFHSLIKYPTRKTLAQTYHNMVKAAYPISQAIDLGVSENIYLKDPDNHSIELCWDRPKEDWPKKPNGAPDMSTKPLNLTSLLAALAP